MTPSAAQRSSSTHAGREHTSTTAYVVTWIGLVLLSVLTAWLSFVPMSAFVAILSALGIAVVKGVMIAAVFMHLAEQRTANAYVLIAALILVTFFVSLTASDVATRVGTSAPDGPSQSALEISSSSVLRSKR